MRSQHQSHQGGKQCHSRHREERILPPESVLQSIRETSIPFISTSADISIAATTISHMTVKTEVGDRDKIGVIQKLIQEHVQVDRIVDLVQQGSSRQLHFGM